MVCLADHGKWNLFLANLAGLGSGLIVYIVAAVVFADVFNLDNPMNLAYGIIALVEISGTDHIKTWSVP